MRKWTLIRVTALLLAGMCLAGCVSVTSTRHQTEPDVTTEQSQTSEEEEYLRKLGEMIALMEEYYVDDFDTSQLGDYLAAAVVAATGDRWSYYISAEEMSAYLEQDANAYVGIGVTIQLVNETDPGFTILSVTKGSPAETAGIQIGDYVVAVEGANAVDLGITECQQRVRGEEGTWVTLTLERDGQQFDLEVQRGVIETVIVTYELMENQIGYVKINNFDTNCARDTLAAIEELRSQGATSLLFDLRFNPGGHLDELVTVLDYLLPECVIFRSVDYEGTESREYSGASCLEMPMAVIINEDSYSAAEYFAAALQEYDWATVIGAQTSGKANYQQTFFLSDGSGVAISTGHYQTPKGVTLDGVGVTPDIPVSVDTETYYDIYYETIDPLKDPQLQAAIVALAE